MSHITKYNSIEWIIKILSEDIPELNIKKIEFMSECFGNKIYLINGHLLARFAKDQLTSLASQVTSKHLTLLRQEKHFKKIPQVIYSRPNQSKSQFFYTLSEYIVGTELSKQLFNSFSNKEKHHLLKEIGHFFYSLHKVDITAYDSLRHFNDWRHIYARQAQYQTIIESQFIGEERKYFLRALNWYCEFFMQDNSAKHLIHGDLTAEHILIGAEQNEISGFIDFDFLSLGRKEIDLARIVQSFGIEVLPSLSDYAEIDYTKECRQIIESFLITECLNFFRKNLDKYRGYEEVLQKAARQSLLSIFDGKYNISEFKSMIRN